MEDKIRDLVNRYSEVLLKNNTQVFLLASLNGFFVKLIIHDDGTKAPIWWSAIRVDENGGLIELESYLKYLENQFSSQYINWIQIG